MSCSSAATHTIVVNGELEIHDLEKNLLHARIEAELLKQVRSQTGVWERAGTKSGIDLNIVPAETQQRQKVAGHQVAGRDIVDAG